MAAVTVLKFSTLHGADAGLVVVHELQTQDLIDVHDAAIVSWPSGKKSPVTRQPVKLAASRGVGGLFWARLFGLIFFTPLLGLDVDAASGAYEGVFKNYGIDDAFVRGVRRAVTEGTSALFLMTDGAIVEELAAAMSDLTFEMVFTQSVREQERPLRETCPHD